MRRARREKGQGWCMFGEWMGRWVGRCVCGYFDAGFLHSQVGLAASEIGSGLLGFVGPVMDWSFFLFFYFRPLLPPRPPPPLPPPLPPLPP